jgi:excisionase family DNA binding protein
MPLGVPGMRVSTAPKPRPALARKRSRSPKAAKPTPSVTCPVLTIPQAMERLSVRSRETVYRLIKSGKLEFTRVGADIRIPVDAIDRYLSAGLVSP